MHQIEGDIYDGPSFDARGMVVRKNAPKFRQTSFWVMLEDRTGLWVDEAHYMAFEALDTIGVVCSARTHSRTHGGGRHGEGLRVLAGDMVVVLAKGRPAVVEQRIRLEYVSNPRKIAGEYWYLVKTEAGWYRIPYGVAKRYWLGDQAAPREEMRGSYYELLGVSKEATMEQIRVAWLEAIKRNHPDKYPASDRDYQGQLAARINAAYDCLSNADERDRYDGQLRGARAPRDEGEAVKAWPGRGFGTLCAVVEIRGDSCLVTQIISWANEEVEFQGSCPLTHVRRGRDGLVLEAVTGSSSMYERAIPVEIPWELVGGPSRLRDIGWATVPPSQLAGLGNVKYHIKGIRSGYWDWERSQIVRQVRVREATLEWPEGFLVALRRDRRQGLGAVPPADGPFNGGLSGSFRPGGRRGR
jgi:hypothetical protein